MEKHVKHANRVARNAAVDIYLSGGNGRVYWPNRLQPAIPGDSTPSVRESCQQYMLDSGFKEGGVPMEQVIDMAYKRQPKYIIPNDTVNTPDVPMRTAVEETAEKVDAFLNAIDEDTFPATVLIPLQPPHDFHYAYLHKHYPEQVNRGHFALGGMKNMRPEDQISCVKQFRRLIGADAYVHGFGLGASRQLIHAIRAEPWLLDSVDFSTPQIHVRSGRVAGHARIPMYIGTASGADLSTTTANLIAAEMTEIARMLDPSLPDEDIEIKWKQFRKQYEQLERVLDDRGELHPDQRVETAASQSGLSEFTATEPTTGDTA